MLSRWTRFRRLHCPEKIPRCDQPIAGSVFAVRFTPHDLAPQILAIARASDEMNSRDREVWTSRHALVYGDMGGQRSFDFRHIDERVATDSAVVAIESLFYLVTVLISTASFRARPDHFLNDQGRLGNADFDRFLLDVLSGQVYEDLGIAGCSNVYPLDWLGQGDSATRNSLKELCRLLAACWNGSELKLAGDDPFQSIHRQLFPSNLAHITGQFFSPEWLAETLLEDVRWKPDQRLIDPFCGSGIFLVKALRTATDAGHPVGETLKQIIGIDINPFAAVATRANLALLIGRRGEPIVDPIHLNVICADAIAPSIRVGNSTEPCVINDASVFQAAEHFGFDLERWIPDCGAAKSPDAPDTRWATRSEIEQSLTYGLKPADVVATNPPWVGWEYLSRPYRKSIETGWKTHDLFQSKGMEASFLKEDLSNLALLAAWSAYLRHQGRSVVILRPSTMKSEVSSRGVRRLSLCEGGDDLKLEQIRTYDSMRLFKSASTAAATWMIRKGEPTEFPVPVLATEKVVARWNPQPSDRAVDLSPHVREIRKFAEPTDPNDCSSRWIIATSEQLRSMRRLSGSSHYTPRMGVFTGGANGVFYLRKTGDRSGYRNITANSKRRVPEVDVDVEPQLVHSIVRGRDIDLWRSHPEVYLLLPHTAATQMKPICEETIRNEYPRTHRYLCSMKQPLLSRKGFAGWEKKLHAEYFYTLQRIGPYTFSPYKVCWRYIANEFVVCVLEHDDAGKVVVPNDKVMFIPIDHPGEAYFVAGFLSSTPVRTFVDCVSEKRQISTGVIKSLAIPTYNPDCHIQQQISDACRTGHAMLRQDADADVGALQQQIDQLVLSLPQT